MQIFLSRFQVETSFFTLPHVAEEAVLATGGSYSVQTDIIGLYKLMPPGVIIPGAQSTCVQETYIEKG